jgi:ribosomal subunit interface protein
MNLKINSRHVEVTPAMRSHLEAGLEKIRKHFDHVLDATAFFLTNQNVTRVSVPIRSKGIRRKDVRQMLSLIFWVFSSIAS